MEREKSGLEKLEELYKEFWRKYGNPSIISAKHTEFMVEPKVFMGDKLNPEILKLLAITYLSQTSKQDSGTGNIEATPDRIIIKSPKGKPLIIIRDKKIIQQYLEQQA